ncbi:MAG: nicotinate phosphoribosyltransferase [bacterium]
MSEGFLYTDQYELTMAQVYFRMGLHEKEVQFDHFFRKYPDYGKHQAGYCINAGLEWFMDWMQNVRFTQEDYNNLQSQTGGAGKPLFQKDFLDWLKANGSYDCLSLQAIPEGRVVHPHEPLTVVQGPLALAQILETGLLNQLNYQILIATKASRMRLAGKNQLLIEFGARRGQDRGANAGARAALIGGADFTSNTGISYALGYPPKGTHAHSLVQLFLTLGYSEEEAFQAFADVFPDDCILLVDTIDTLESGLPNAIRVFEKLKEKGHQPMGIRLDSGDLAYLAVQSAKVLDKAGFPEVKIVLSNELDELNIWQILKQIRDDSKQHGVDPDHLIKRLVYGVGTRLITSTGHPAIDGIYKLTAVEQEKSWKPSIKISESLQKVPHPGIKKGWRLYDQRGKATADLIGQEQEELATMQTVELQHPFSAEKKRIMQKEEISNVEELLVPILKNGKQVYDFPDIEEMRNKRDADLECLDAGVKRIINPHRYHVSLTLPLWRTKQELLESLKKEKG